jgi:hypothetical protein
VTPDERAEFEAELRAMWALTARSQTALAAIPELVARIALDQAQLQQLVDEARETHSWAVIADALGVTRQSAHQRFARREGIPPIAEPEPVETQAVNPRDEVAARRARSGVEGRRRKRRRSRR